MKRVLLFESLESKALLGTLCVVTPQPTLPVAVPIGHPLPPPQPDNDSGDPPGDDPPIVYPPIPPS